MEATVDQKIASDPSLAIRTYFETSDGSFKPDGRPLVIPSFVREIASEYGLRSGASRLSAVPEAVRTNSQVERLRTELLDPDRRFTAILFFETSEGGTVSRLADALSESLVGVAKVYTIAADAAVALGKALGNDLTAGGIAARAFPPGTDLANQLGFLWEDLASEEGAYVVTGRLETFAGTVSVEQFRPGVEVPSFEEAYQHSRNQRRRNRSNRESARLKGKLENRDAQIARLKQELAIAAKGAERPTIGTGREDGAAHERSLVSRQPDSRLTERVSSWFGRAGAGLLETLGGREKAHLREQLATGIERIKELERQLAKSREEVQWLSDEHNEADRAAKAKQERIEELEPELEELRWRLRKRGEDPDIPLPDSWSEFFGWWNDHLADRVMLSPRAIREVRNPAFRDVGMAARGVVWLATKYRDFRIEGKGGDLRGPCGAGLSNERCGGDSFAVEWAGAKVPVEWHVKNTNTMDPRRCLRIYYFWDATNRQAVVASMPGHV